MPRGRGAGQPHASRGRALAASLAARVSSPPCPTPPRKLPRQLGLWSATAVLVGSTIGSGIFRSPAGIAGAAPGSAPAARGVGRRRALRALRRAHARRDRGRLPADGRHLRVPARGVGAPPGVPLRLGGARRHPRRELRRDLDDLRRVLLPRARPRSGGGAVRDVRALGGGARDRADRDVQLRRIALGLARAEPHDAREVRRAVVHHPARLRARAAAHGRALHAGGAAGELHRSAPSDSRSCRCSGRTTAGRT